MTTAFSAPAIATTPTLTNVDAGRAAQTQTPDSTIGLMVFIAVVLVIAGGALVLYLQHRPRRTGHDSAAGSASDPD